MIEKIFDPGGCVGCPPEMGCIGKRNCPQCYTPEFYCDECGEQTLHLINVSGRELCKECLAVKTNVFKNRQPD